ncbi:MAG: hypothetical protein ACXVXP_13295, partial [Mycobacteriaceae bacterium]
MTDLPVTTVLVLQPSETNPLGPMEQWLLDAGVQLRTVRPYAGDSVVGSLEGVDAVVCLGGEMDAADDVSFPWLQQVRDLLSTAVRQGVPLFALCLGAQLHSGVEQPLLHRSQGVRLRGLEH